MTKAFVPSRLPRPHDPRRGQEVAAKVTAMSSAQTDLLVGAAGCSPFLAGLIEREAEWLHTAFGDIDKALADELSAASDWTAPDLSSLLRRAKRRVALITALADLGGVWALEKVTGTLSGFAEVATTAALRAAISVQVRRKKLPGVAEADIETTGGMVVLGMGKLGAHELNYSSDIDLICLFDESRFAASEFHEARAGFIRATRAMCATLSEMTGEGYVFRTDLRLRPDPAVTPVCMTMEAAERYYESLGRTWERAAYIKARPLAGDLAAGERFLRTLAPFVWRKHLDFAAIQDAHDMQLAIREHKGLGGPITLPGHNMKLGRGGIREIEFFTQTRQLIAGGRDPSLRLRGTKESLSLLADRGWVPQDVAATLADHYTMHRTVEHRLQMMRDAQTHSLPQSEAGFEELVALMGTTSAQLRQDLHHRLSEVHKLTEGFFAPQRKPAGETPAFDPKILDRWRSYPALRSERGQSLFARLQPEILRRLAAAAKPEAALLAFDGFLSQVPAGVQLFSLLDTNPSLLELLVDIVSTSPALAQHLSRNAVVLDAVIGGDFFTDWPGQAGLEKALAAELDRAADYEAQLNATRRWTKEWHFRVGVHLLRGLITPQEAMDQYSDLARANLALLLPVVERMFAVRHGPTPGRGAVVLGMGSLGAGTLSATSDLDLIVVYDADGVETSEGDKPLITRVYYAKLTQALITALTAPTAEGKLYEVDMRLRPSGNQGPVATSLAAFRHYQENEAWLWEHLALIRARPVAGPEALAADIEAFRHALLARPVVLADVAREVGQMRARIAAAKSPAGLWDVKIGAGRLQEIELLAQAGALLSGQPTAQVDKGLEGAVHAGLIGSDAQERLAETAAYLARVNVVVRLLGAGPLVREDLAPASRAFLARALEAKRAKEIEARLQGLYEQAAELLDQALAPYLPKEQE